MVRVWNVSMLSSPIAISRHVINIKPGKLRRIRGYVHLRKPNAGGRTCSWGVNAHINLVPGIAAAETVPPEKL